MSEVTEIAFDKYMTISIKNDALTIYCVEDPEKSILVSSEHEQDCCEINYLDIEPLIEYQGFRIRSIKKTDDGHSLLWFLGNGDVVLTNARSSQNGYYSTDVTIVFYEKSTGYPLHEIWLFGRLNYIE